MLFVPHFAFKHRWVVSRSRSAGNSSKFLAWPLTRMHWTPQSRPEEVRLCPPLYASLLLESDRLSYWTRNRWVFDLVWNVGCWSATPLTSWKQAHDGSSQISRLCVRPRNDSNLTQHCVTAEMGQTQNEFLLLVCIKLHYSGQEESFRNLVKD